MNRNRLDLRRTLPAALLVSALGIIGSGASAADTRSAAAPGATGWQKVMARKGVCVISVPSDWKVDPILKGTASANDNSASAVISRADGVSTLAEVKPVMEGNFKPTKTFEDTAQRLWYQYSIGAQTAWYVGVPVKGGICGAQITFKPGKEAIANKIAASVGGG